ncbi:hypothetical protein Prudu_005340, partial [Prunus dulcis]
EPRLTIGDRGPTGPGSADLAVYRLVRLRAPEVQSTRMRDLRRGVEVRRIHHRPSRASAPPSKGDSAEFLAEV